MRSFIITLLISFNCILLSSQTGPLTPRDWIDGNGGEISNLAELRWLSETPEAWDEDWKLVSDIDASETRIWNISGEDTLGFSPIGDIPYGTRQQIPFTGTLNGNGHVISNLYIKRIDDDNIGFIGATDESARIEKLGLMNLHIEGKELVGGMIGNANYLTRVEQCFTHGYVSGTFCTGGLIGFSIMVCRIYSDYSTCTVNGGERAGGLLGGNQNAFVGINKSYAIGPVSGSDMIGAVVGWNCNLAQIDSSYFDTLSTGLNTGIGYDMMEEEVIGLSTDDFAIQNNFTGWDFENIWEIAKIDSIDPAFRPYFKWQLHKFTINFEAGNYGHIVGDSIQYVAYGSDASTIRAEPIAGAVFERWSDSQGNFITYDNPLLLKDIKSDSSLYAVFILLPEEIHPYKNELNLTIYPNPANDILFIESPDYKIISIFDMKGRVIKTYGHVIWQNNLSVISLVDLNPGLYIIQVVTLNNFLIKKLRIVR
jgi:hypothetical protein